MNKLKDRINQFNKIKYPKDNSKRIIIATLSVNSGRKWNVTKGSKDTKQQANVIRKKPKIPQHQSHRI